MPTAPFTLRRAAAGDAATLASLGAATFTEKFGHLYPPEDLQTFLDQSHSVGSWSSKLGDRNSAVWLAQSADGAPAGFIAVGGCKLPLDNLEAAAGEVYQLYVLARHHNQKLGTWLMEAGLLWLGDQGRHPLYVGVWSENYGAQRFYARYGFIQVGEYGFSVGKTIDRELILRR